jgi:small subunit ribosomal protein S17
MADEKDNDTPESAEAQTPAEEASAAPEAAAAGEPQTALEAEEAVKAEQANPAEEASEAGDAATAPEPQETPEADAAEAPAAVAEEPAEQISHKERRRRARAARKGGPGPQRSPEERHAERLSERRRKAVRRRARRLQERAKAVERRAAAPAREPLAPVHAPVEGTRRVRQGIVVSDKAEKTITVRIDIARRHRRYEKIVRSSSTLHAHDENNDAHEGDVVRVIESRPLSRTKRWKLVDVVERAR